MTGVEYWIVDPHDRSIQVFCLRDGRFGLDQEVEKEGRISSRVLPGFGVALAEVFAEAL